MRRKKLLILTAALIGLSCCLVRGYGQQSGDPATGTMPPPARQDPPPLPISPPLPVPPPMPVPPPIPLPPPPPPSQAPLPPLPSELPSFAPLWQGEQQPGCFLN